MPIKFTMPQHAAWHSPHAARHHWLTRASLCVRASGAELFATWYWVIKFALHITPVSHRGAQHQAGTEANEARRTAQLKALKAMPHVANMAEKSNKCAAAK